MVLIADSGSTKTDWACISDNSVDTFTTLGINPVTQNSEILEDRIKQVFEQVHQPPIKIYHYGAGCKDIKARNKLSEHYKKYFIHSDIIIETDILGAARAVCKGEPGLVCILGTGSNAAFSDGHQIIQQFPSLGYILGDEGSSSHLSKKLIRAFYLEEIDLSLRNYIRSQLPQLDDSFIFNFYSEPNQNQKFSDIASFIVKNNHIHELQNLIKLSFMEFIDIRLLPLLKTQNVQVYVVGSIGFYLSEQFNACLNNRGLRAGTYIQKPIEGLINYHKSYEIH